MDVGFVWDERKYREVVQRHGVLFYEVVCSTTTAGTRLPIRQATQPRPGSPGLQPWGGKAAPAAGRSKTV